MKSSYRFTDILESVKIFSLDRITHYCIFNCREQCRKLVYRNSASLHDTFVFLNAHFAGSRSPVAFSANITIACVWQNVRKYIQTNETFHRGGAAKSGSCGTSLTAPPSRGWIVSHNLSTRSPRIRAGIMRLRGHSSK